MATPPTLLRKANALRRAFIRGVSWNWVYWYWSFGPPGASVLAASIPYRFVELIEAGHLSVEQVATTLALRPTGRLAAFTPYVGPWRAALSAVLELRKEIRQARLLGEVAYQFAASEQWEMAFQPIWEAAELERKYSGRVVKWRSLLYLIAGTLVRSGNDDPRVRSVAEAATRDPRT